MYPKVSDAIKKQVDTYGTHNALKIAELLQNFSQNIVSNVAVGGASDSTANTMLMVAPEKMKITKVQHIMTKVQTGAGNTPTVGLYNVTQSAVIAVSGAIALSGSIGDVANCTIDTDEQEVAKGDVLAVQVINPAGTITVAIEGVLQVEYNTIA